MQKCWFCKTRERSLRDQDFSVICLFFAQVIGPVHRCPKEPFAVAILNDFSAAIDAKAAHVDVERRVGHRGIETLGDSRTFQPGHDRGLCTGEDRKAVVCFRHPGAHPIMGENACEEMTHLHNQAGKMNDAVLTCQAGKTTHIGRENGVFTPIRYPELLTVSAARMRYMHCSTS